MTTSSIVWLLPHTERNSPQYIHMNFSDSSLVKCDGPNFIKCDPKCSSHHSRGAFPYIVLNWIYSKSVNTRNNFHFCPSKQTDYVGRGMRIPVGVLTDILPSAVSTSVRTPTILCSKILNPRPIYRNRDESPWQKRQKRQKLSTSKSLYGAMSATEQSMQTRSEY